MFDDGGDRQPLSGGSYILLGRETFFLKLNLNKYCCTPTIIQVNTGQSRCPFTAVLITFSFDLSDLGRKIITSPSRPKEHGSITSFHPTGTFSPRIPLNTGKSTQPRWQNGNKKVGKAICRQTRLEKRGNGMAKGRHK